MEGHLQLVFVVSIDIVYKMVFNTSLDSNTPLHFSPKINSGSFIRISKRNFSSMASSVLANTCNF